ncbi:uncharacterized protein LOC143216179 [Lasioglossum baleicum]|uniref:uncharacterized protein LOC143216179 n=1 Tax=Lasioglossum baleicum TaxID=434251 RepID=UPI003FCC956F
MAAFWFLDTLALQVLKRKTILDENYLIVLVSWLAGEMMLIREKKLPREEFFRLMKELFHQAANKISEMNRCPYWDEIVWENPEEPDVDERKDDQEATLEDFEQTSSKKFRTSGSTVDKKESFSPNGEDEFEPFSSSVDPLVVLDTLMESTYDMYANELRYELVYAVFAEQIEVQNYTLPFSIRKPRPAKLSDPEISPFSVILRRTFVTHDLYGLTSGKGKKKKKIIPEAPSTPANSLHDDEALVEKRRFILPLVEANETIALFDQAEKDA